MAPSQITIWSSSSLPKNFCQIRPSTLDLVTPPTCYICASVWLKVKHKDWFDKTPKLERLQMIWPMKLRGAFNFFYFFPNKFVLSMHMFFARHDLLSPPPLDISKSPLWFTCPNQENYKFITCYCHALHHLW
jgi:hypothetical protein